jgi:hypothetical protein
LPKPPSSRSGNKKAGPWGPALIVLAAISVSYFISQLLHQPITSWAHYFMGTY